MKTYKYLSVERKLSIVMLLGSSVVVFGKLGIFGNSTIPYFILLLMSGLLSTSFTIKLIKIPNKTIPSNFLCVLGGLYLVYLGWVYFAVFHSIWSQ